MNVGDVRSIPVSEQSNEEDVQSCKMSKLSSNSSLRWAFRSSTWLVGEKEWTLAMQCIQPEERQRISKFVFKRDAKSSMSGRLLMRKAISSCLQIPNDEIDLARTNKGKPFLRNQVPGGLEDFNFNVSHQGVFAVLAAEPHHKVGIDVMQIEYPKPQGVRKFFDTMSRQFTTDEWKFIKDIPDEYQQLSRFYRIWCLKESYVKTIGIGIGFELKRLNFKISTVNLEKGVLTMDTVVYVDGKKQTNWQFEETMLDRSHHVAVALMDSNSETDILVGKSHVHINEEVDYSTDTGEESCSKDHLFKMIDFEELTEDMKPISPTLQTFWDSFKSKQEKPVMR